MGRVHFDEGFEVGDWAVDGGRNLLEERVEIRHVM